MNKKLLSVIMAGAMAIALVACGGNKPAETKGSMAASEAAKSEVATSEPAKSEAAPSEAAKDAPKPGESGFLEIPIGEDQIVGPFQVACVYFQGVDMVPENKQPSAEESDMHLEADIHMTPEAGKQFGFGDGEDIWPAYLTVDYKVMSEDGATEITSGTMMPMNADDGAHYGINVKKGVIPVGKYKLVIEIKPSEDYLLHVDSETGVPVAQDGDKAAAEKYYEKQTVTFDWNYDASQLDIK